MHFIEPLIRPITLPNLLAYASGAQLIASTVESVGGALLPIVPKSFFQPFDVASR